MLLCFFFSFLSFILFLKSLHLKFRPSWASELTLFPFWILKDLCILSSSKSASDFDAPRSHLYQIPYKMSLNEASLNHKLENVEETDKEMSVLDLPELALECILERLPPGGLFSMASVCNSLRTRCTSDHLWQRHMDQKWGRVIGPAAYREWECFIAARRNYGCPRQGKIRGLMKLLSFLPFSWIKSKLDNSEKERKSHPTNSTMSWYLALETGKFWFPTQVYNRENGHVGFMLSCYDAELCYDARTDTFQARYPPHGRRAAATEGDVTWNRLRAPPVNTRDLHRSSCLSDLRPGDHIEIQWRRNKEFPYGWWYGVVGHLESCDGSEFYCRCYDSDMVALHFNQYAMGSRWRQRTIDRRNHREEGNEDDGFYGGIRKLNSEEVSTWKRLWPSEALE
ncbi:hypothetical protein SAY87_028604 [Trapa incisa]|uniref:F-box domain-containing protein n=1 Tax=Trapa incisa TaxID=236973 RepID=A0AAN7QS68_9MYRT|nr:hypothetical protein SAY87_028604 [Trapa incisa]